MTDYPHNYAEITLKVSDVTNSLNRARRFGVLWRDFTGRKIIGRGEAYMEGARLLILLCRPLMSPDDRDDVRVKYNIVRDMRAKLGASDLSAFKRLRGAMEFKRLSKETWEIVKITSNQALDNSAVGPLDGTDPPGRTSLFALCVNSRNVQAGALATPEESDRPPHGLSTDSHAAATSSIVEWIQDIEMTELPSGAAGTGSGHPRDPQGPVSIGVGDASVPKTELRDESLSSCHSAQPISPIPILVLASGPGPNPGTQSPDGPRAALPPTEVSFTGNRWTDTALQHAHWNMQTQPLGLQGVEFFVATLPPGSLLDHWMTDGAQEDES
ncbi:hypothetical protein EDB85DRAFT_1949377 [Lactarius pseudohatsudake]|nr:hypothetical protein EDB85DRAFT_1949377 [Lactarius pseudohatsudake]